MTARGGPKGAGDASPHGREARRFVGQTGVIVHRPAKRRGSGKRHEVRGAPLGLRAAVADLRDVKGGVRARWRLRPDAARKQGDAAPVASWSYWRWQVENLHESLESAGRQSGSWLQGNGARVLRKVVVALAARVGAWDWERRTADAPGVVRAVADGVVGAADEGPPPRYNNGSVGRTVGTPAGRDLAGP